MWISSHRLLEPQEAQICHFTMTSGNDSLQMRTDRKQTEKAVLLRPLSGWPWAFSFQSVSFYKAPAQTKAAWAPRSHWALGFTSLSANCSQQAPPQLPGSEWHLPPGAADTEALRTRIQLVWITNRSVLSHPSLHLIFLTVRIHYGGNRVSRNKPLSKISKPSSNKVLRKQAQGESGQQEEGNQNWISALTPGPAAVIPN